MIKKVEYIDTPFSGKDNSKLVKFTKDIRDVIDLKIEYAEIVDMPYADSSANADLDYKARKICREYFWELYGRCPQNTDFFRFAKRTKEDGVHWYVRFNVSAYEKTVTELELS